jgi:hypothetical protein
MKTFAEYRMTFGYNSKSELDEVFYSFTIEIRPGQGSISETLQAAMTAIRKYTSDLRKLFQTTLLIESCETRKNDFTENITVDDFDFHKDRYIFRRIYNVHITNISKKVELEILNRLSKIENKENIVMNSINPNGHYWIKDGVMITSIEQLIKERS